MRQCKMRYEQKFGLSEQLEDVSVPVEPLVLVQSDEMPSVVTSKKRFSCSDRVFFRRMSAELDRGEQRDRLLFRFSNDSTELHRCEFLVPVESKPANRNRRDKTLRRFAIVERLSFSSERFLLGRTERTRAESKFVVSLRSSPKLRFSSDAYRWVTSASVFSTWNFFCSGQPAHQFNFYFQQFDQCVGLSVRTNSSTCLEDATCPAVARFLCELCRFFRPRKFLFELSRFQIEHEKLILKLFTTVSRRTTLKKTQRGIFCDIRILQQFVDLMNFRHALVVGQKPSRLLGAKQTNVVSVAVRRRQM